MAADEAAEASEVEAVDMEVAAVVTTSRHIIRSHQVLINLMRLIGVSWGNE